MSKTVTSKNLKIKQLLSKAKKHIKTGDTVNAEELYNTVLTLQPHNVITKKNLNKLQRKSKQSIQTHQPDDLQDQIHGLISIYRSGDMLKTEKSCKNLLQKYPYNCFYEIKNTTTRPSISNKDIAFLYTKKA